MQARMLKEQQVEAERVIESITSALVQDKQLLTEDELQAIEQGIAELSAVKQGSDSDAIKQAIDALDQLTATFAERRMDNSIRTALAGHSVDEV